ncbi:hypothetical protein BH20CHL6_BH20CHL6_11790 [soil metagenome]
MAKRTRGNRPTRSRTAPNRPGTARSVDARSAQPGTASQLEAAAQIADDVEHGHPAEVHRELRRVSGSTPARARTPTGGLLASRAATEYVYVAQDIRRIVLLSGLLFGLMLLLWLLISVLGVVSR